MPCSIPCCSLHMWPGSQPMFSLKIAKQVFIASIVFMVHIQYCDAARLVFTENTYFPWHKATDTRVIHLSNPHNEGKYRARKLFAHPEDLQEILEEGRIFSLPLSFEGEIDDYENVCSFLLTKNPVTPENLLRKVPGLVSLIGFAQTRDEAHMCFGSKLTVTWSPRMGLYAQVLAKNGIWYADPVSGAEQHDMGLGALHLFRQEKSTTDHKSEVEEMKKSASKQVHEPWHCEVHENEDDFDSRNLANEQITDYKPGNYYVPRSFSLAVLASQSYVDARGGTLASALEGIVTTITRVSSIYQQDLGLELRMVSDQEKLVQVGNTPLRGMNNETYTIDEGIRVTDVTSVINAIIGEDAYDVGHMFSTGSGGSAEVGVVCNVNRKGHGVSGGPVAEGSAFDVDYVAHELGHQFGARHTFAGLDKFCGENVNFVSRSAVEPGSGSTIMGYAGICGVDNLQSNTDPYFHAMSIVQVANFVEGLPSSCGKYVLAPDYDAENDPPPLLSAVQKERPKLSLRNRVLSVPKQTAFELSLAEREPSMLYNWEQVDTATEPWSLPEGPDKGTESQVGPRFRSYMPTENGAKRMFPSKELLLLKSPTGEVASDKSAEDLGDDDGDIVSEYIIQAEVAARAERLPLSSPFSMLFAVTARSPSGGFSLTTLRVNVAEAGPLEITRPSPSAKEVSSNSIIEWNPNGVEVLSDTAQVFLSIDGGETFPFLVGSAPMEAGVLAIEPPAALCGDGTSLLTSYSNARVMVSSASQQGMRFLAITPTRVTFSCAPKSASVVLVTFLSIASCGVIAVVGILIHRRYIINSAMETSATPVVPTTPVVSSPSVPAPRLGDDDTDTVWSEPNAMFNGQQADSAVSKGVKPKRSFRKALEIKKQSYRRGKPN